MLTKVTQRSPQTKSRFLLCRSCAVQMVNIWEFNKICNPKHVARMVRWQCIDCPPPPTSRQNAFAPTRTKSVFALWADGIQPPKPEQANPNVAACQLTHRSNRSTRQRPPETWPTTTDGCSRPASSIPGVFPAVWSQVGVGWGGGALKKFHCHVAVSHSLRRIGHLNSSSVNSARLRNSAHTFTRCIVGW